MLEAADAILGFKLVQQVYQHALASAWKALSDSNVPLPVLAFLPLRDAEDKPEREKPSDRRNFMAQRVE